MFYSFSTQEERSNFNGSCFIEIAFCKLPSNTCVRRIVSVRSIHHWQDDSLYVNGDDMDEFFRSYSCIFDSGMYSNLKSGVVDCCGINYYEPKQIPAIIEKLFEKEPSDYQKLVDWLNCAKQYNGFYILGV